MVQPILPAPPSTGTALLLWAATRFAGGLLLLIILYTGAALIDANTPPEPPSTDHELFDGIGAGVAVVLFFSWGISFDFICSLPLLLILPSRIGRALQEPDGKLRRKQFYGAVAGWQGLLAVAGVVWLGFNGTDPGTILMLLCLAALYMVAALGTARLLYSYWLADYYYFEEGA